MLHAIVEQVASGLVIGSIYAALALALVMIFNSTGHVNFAQGEMAMFSTYLAWAMIQAGLPYWQTFPAAVALSFAGGAAIERAILRPLRHAPVLSVVVVFVGLLLVFNSVAGWIWGSEVKEFPSPLHDVSVGSLPFGAHDLAVIAVTLALLLLLFAFFRFTRLGLAMRGTAENPESAQLLGIRIGWMLALGWGLAAAIGAIAGMLVAPVVFLEPNMMAGVLIYALAAALLGGIDSPAGAIAGGLIVGVLENLAGAFLIGDELKRAFALAIVIGVLILRPRGLFGKIVVKRV